MSYAPENIRLDISGATITYNQLAKEKLRYCAPCRK